MNYFKALDAILAADSLLYETKVTAANALIDTMNAPENVKAIVRSTFVDTLHQNEESTSQ